MSVTDTPAFRRWFADSKVVNVAGKPLVVYHGTDAEFSSFRIPENGVAYFTPNQDYGYIRKSPHVVAAYLSIQRPYWVEVTRFVEGLRSDPETVAELKAEGYDGVIYAKKDNLEKGPLGWGNDYPQIVVFDPHQIKSATGNRGTFDPADFDIRHNPKRPTRAPRAPRRARRNGADEYFDDEYFDEAYAGSSSRKPMPEMVNIDTPAFRRWFGASKVVGWAGQPLLVFQGSPRSGFSKFRSGVVHYFTDDSNVATTYLGSRRAIEEGISEYIWEGPSEPRPGIYVAYLKMERPLIVDAKGHDYASIPQSAVPFDLNTASKFLRGRVPSGSEGWTTDDVATVARHLGYDGVIFQRILDEGGDINDESYGGIGTSTVYAVFSPTQIKSATSNRGTFDPKDPDIRHNPATARRTHPALWRRIVAEMTASSKGGRPGQWSARKAQFAVSEYKAQGGGYIGPKTPDNSLVRWTEERWRTRSGLPSLATGERYLPTRAIAALTAEEYAATSARKRAGMRRGQQFVPQPESVAMKTAKYRRNGETLRIFEADGAAYFQEPVLIREDESAQGYKAKDAIVFLSPDDFLRVAKPGESAQKTETVRQLIRGGHRFADMPFLRFSHEEGSTKATVVGHEGRHRARALKAAGVRLMPVVLTGPIRWDQQMRPASFDYKKVLPHTLFGEEEHSDQSIPMPIPIHYPELESRMRAKGNPLRHARRNGEPQVGDRWTWAGHTREIVAIEDRDGERKVYVRESESPRVLMIYSAEKFPAHKARELRQDAEWEARRPQREQEQRERAEREARETARREAAEAAERSLVARLRAFATAEHLTEKQKEKMKVDFRSLVSYKGKTYSVVDLIEEKVKVDGWGVSEAGLEGPNYTFIAKKSITALGLRYARYLWRKEHPPEPEPEIQYTEQQKVDLARLFGVSPKSIGSPKRKRRNPRFALEEINALPVGTVLVLEADDFVGVDAAWVRAKPGKIDWVRLVPNGDHWLVSLDTARPGQEFMRIVKHASDGRRFSLDDKNVLS